MFGPMAKRLPIALYSDIANPFHPGPLCYIFIARQREGGLKMSETFSQREFARALLLDVAPDEEEFLDAYEAAVTGDVGGRRIGTGMGLPPEMIGALGMVAVWVSRSLFEKLLEWSGNMVTEIAKKSVVDTSVDKLKKWLLAPGKESLAGVMTPAGELEILAIVERDAQAAGLSRDDVQKLQKAAIKRLGLLEPKSDA
jgi:hypothetical protein